MTTLSDAVAGAQVVITCGPGGIGKTTSAAALGAAIARTTSQRVLVLTVDPARRLADALGVQGIGNEPTPVDVSGEGSYAVAMLDPQACWDALIVKEARDADTAQRILTNSLYQNITRRFVQSYDYIAMERLFELVGRGTFDVIIVDTPPTRNALDFLDAPGRMADFFSSRFLKWLIAPTRGGVANVAAKPLTYMANRILGGAFLADITEFFLLLSSLYDGFVERARTVDELLHQPTTRFVVVSTIETVPLREAAFFNEALTERSYHVGGWLVNRLLPEAFASSTFRDEQERFASSDAGDATVRAAVARVADDMHRRATFERARLRRLATEGTPLFTADTAEDDLGSVQGITRLGERLLRSERVLELPAT